MSIVASQDRPDMDVRVSVPVQDMTAVPSFDGFEPDKLRSPAAESRRTGGGPRRARRAGLEIGSGAAGCHGWPRAESGNAR